MRLQQDLVRVLRGLKDQDLAAPAPEEEDGSAKKKRVAAGELLKDTTMQLYNLAQVSMSEDALSPEHFFRTIVCLVAEKGKNKQDGTVTAGGS